MAAFCFIYGLFILFYTGDGSRLTAGPVVFFLGMVCLNLYATAATIIRQLIGTFHKGARIFFPIFAYSVSIITIVAGIVMYSNSAQLYVSGHVVEGLGFICLCVATAATCSSKFALIPKNSAKPNIKPSVRCPQAFTPAQENAMKAVVIIASILAWCDSIILLSQSWGSAANFVAGSVVGGIACICTSLIALVYSIINQISGLYDNTQRRLWPQLVLGMGIVAGVWGIVVFFFNISHTVDFVGFLLIGLSLICFSISSKVILLAKVWRASYPLANRIPIIPVVTALCCLFLSAFLFEGAMVEVKFAVPARVLTAFGAVCFTLFSIVSILESGTKH